MRVRGVEPLALSALLLAACLAHGQPGPMKGGDKDKPPAKSKLEETLEQALKYNPDVRVAEAKVREAEAVLSRTRLSVVQKVATLLAAHDAAKKGVENAEIDLKRMESLAGRGAIPEGEIRAARKALLDAKAELAKIEAELPYVTGKTPLEDPNAQTRSATAHALAALGLAIREAETASANEAAIASALRYLKAQQLPETPMRERIRKALDKPVRVDFRTVPLDMLVRDLFEKADLPVQIKGDFERSPAVTLMAKEPMPFGAALQLLEDFSPTPLSFLVRDYGVLVTDAKALPGDAVTLHHFWKSKAVEVAGGSTTKPSERNPPKGDVEGAVTGVDPSGLIRISIGSDAGLEKGHTLELFRLGDKPKYLGSIRILQAKAKESVAQPIGKLTEAPQNGDHVANRILGK
jgi:hypothetical protein